MTDHLLQLVNSLTQAEKRSIHLNLKLYSGEDGTNNLLSDFTSLTHFTGLKNKKKVPTIKSNISRLYHRLLDLLIDLYKEQLYDNENDNRFIKRSQILFHKGFYKDGVKYLEKVIQKKEAFSYLLKIEAIELRIRAAIKFVDIDYLKNDFEKEKALLAEISKFYFNLIEFESIWAIVKLESSVSYFYGEKNELLQKFTGLLSDEANALSPAAKIHFHQINSFLNMKENELDKAETHMVRVIELFSAYPELRNNKFGDYLRALRNLCIIYLRTQGFEEIEDFLKEVSAEIDSMRKSRSPAFRNDVFTLTVLLRLNNIITNEKVKEHTHLISEFESNLKESAEFVSLDERSTTYFLLGLSYFILGDHKRSLRMTNQAIVHSKTVRKDIRHVALMLEMCLHFNLENHELLNSKMRSYQKHLLKQKEVFSFEKELIGWLHRIIQQPNETALFKNFHSFIRESLETDQRNDYLTFIPFLYLKPF